MLKILSLSILKKFCKSKSHHSGSLSFYLIRLYSSNSASINSNNSTLSIKPALNFNHIISNPETLNKNLIHRKSHLSPDTLEDIVYLHNESKNLSKRLAEARQRHNSLGNKIKDAINNNKSLKEKENSTKSSNQIQDLLSLNSNNSINQNQTDLLGTSNLGLSEKVQDYHTEAATLKESILNLSKDAITLEQRLLSLALQLPNDLHPDVPIGPYSNSQIVSSSYGIKSSTDSLPFNSFDQPCRSPDLNRDHLNIMTQLGWLSFADAQKTTGPSFAFLIGNGAFLELALIQYALSLALRDHWNLTIGPDLIRTDLSDRCGFSPRDGGESNQTYFVSTSKNSLAETSSDPSLNSLTRPTHCLAATAEIPLVSSHHSITLPNSTYPSFPSQPIQLVTLGNAYRAEAGSRGTEKADNRSSEKMLQKMLNFQIKLIESLNLPYRVLQMSSQELGAPAYHKYDIETWMPGRGRWGEVSSASNCTDYQSRRLAIRYRAQQNIETPTSDPSVAKDTSSMPSKTSITKKSNEKSLYVHTLNATAAAMPRLIVSLIENGIILNKHNKPVKLELPASLKPFWLGEHTDIEWI
ncbi:hypothetical protein O181_037387 [Austropuccinia psidii MF-1]|uniref:serine--tRNA ligase n=1 Tax=Austropuccinia psidii MF-1 TaxID=1389203 RepID=A0A9Q3DCK9_9BASI|nr:hypothetical protein [Austropuccinia psidii MF-1]